MVSMLERPTTSPSTRSIFADAKSKLFATYRARLQFRDRILGGIPKDPKIIEGWLRTKAGVTNEEEIRQMLIRTMQETGQDVDAGASFEELIAASEKIAGQKQTQGFKFDDTGLYIESRIIKAAIKEDVNILWAGYGEKDEKGKRIPAFGRENNPTAKGAKSFVAERIFVNPDRIYLLRDGEPVTKADGIHLSIGHITGPSGPRSTLGYHEYVEQPVVEFEVMATRDCIPGDDWATLWAQAEENGIGTSRSMGFGRFDFLLWERVN